MTKLLALLAFGSLFLCLKVSANIRLIALVTAGNSSVNLRWNMVNYPGNTAYTLFKSKDGVTWTIAAANPVFRDYSESTILAYTDKFSDENKLYYRVKIYDKNENIVDVSNTTVVDNPVTNYPEKRSIPYQRNSPKEKTVNPGSNAWQIFPNPVGNLLTLIYKGNEMIKGVINIIIQDASGKVVIRFRAASNNKQPGIDVSKLHAGIYFIKLNVLNELKMNAKFVKQ